MNLSRQNVKVITLGNRGVGKCTIINQFARKTPDKFLTTLSYRCLSETLYLQGTSICFRLYETFGAETFGMLNSGYYRMAGVALLVYDVTNYQSFADLEKWYDRLLKYAPSDVIKVLVGNKEDKYLEEKVPYEEASHFAQLIGAQLRITCALNLGCVISLFNEIGQTIINEKGEDPK